MPFAQSSMLNVVVFFFLKKEVDEHEQKKIEKNQLRVKDVKNKEKKKSKQSNWKTVLYSFVTA